LAFGNESAGVASERQGKVNKSKDNKAVVKSNLNPASNVKQPEKRVDISLA